MVGYYPDGFDIARIVRQYPELEMVDEDEEERLVDVLDRKKRGKGPPKKAKTACESSLFFSGYFLYFCFGVKPLKGLPLTSHLISAFVGKLN
jgi:hypothetical protein